MKKHLITDIVKIFQMQNPWFYIIVPPEIVLATKERAYRGLIPITVTLGKSVWNTSILPMGNGIKFIPLKALIRKNENIDAGSKIELTFILRKLVYNN
jgi:hypothetical protein